MSSKLCLCVILLLPLLCRAKGGMPLTRDAGIQHCGACGGYCAKECKHFTPSTECGCPDPDMTCCSGDGFGGNLCKEECGGKCQIAGCGKNEVKSSKIECNVDCRKLPIADVEVMCCVPMPDYDDL
ncbi:uncharacterized protein LOC102809863 [Saccoglossus kowalevskii]|uniref:Uncharacterized protein LOC102809863 n=1 Tax=Saccoglossus kowalevskii TaxID=10224 RepID=A0ABM0N0J6_SACKO|nr:PREDICTED: uncharacterized protein LOC102809863 [Saccoglossus kowalevskii]